jgi:hypothetical protein
VKAFAFRGDNIGAEVLASRSKRSDQRRQAIAGIARYVLEKATSSDRVWTHRLQLLLPILGSLN